MPWWEMALRNCAPKSRWSDCYLYQRGNLDRVLRSSCVSWASPEVSVPAFTDLYSSGDCVLDSMLLSFVFCSARWNSSLLFPAMSLLSSPASRPATQRTPPGNCLSTLQHRMLS
ncbi:hypothetical protein ATANTOWER_030098 [Ataeniobius toweri]|uniref:Uncharacterized protein n=1 Tax=Ataeniobius toweri TaxID=208326 RepID=A0ABU7B5F9_9TELE|nr:hypothetical protein [Ataeniobius toweri]